MPTTNETFECAVKADEVNFTFLLAVQYQNLDKVPKIVFYINNNEFKVTTFHIKRYMYH